MSGNDEKTSAVLSSELNQLVMEENHTKMELGTLEGFSGKINVTVSHEGGLRPPVQVIMSHVDGREHVRLLIERKHLELQVIQGNIRGVKWNLKEAIEREMPEGGQDGEE